MLGRFGDGDGCAEEVGLANIERQFEFVVQGFGGKEFRLRLIGGWARLAGGTDDGHSAGDDGGGSAVIGDGKVLVVGEERLVGAEELADSSGVVDGGVEVGVVGDADGLYER